MRKPQSQKVSQSWIKITWFSAKFEFRFESFKSKFTLILSVSKLMTGCSKNNRENYPRKCFWTKEKETQVLSGLVSTLVFKLFDIRHRDRGWGGAGRAAAPPLFALKRKIIKIKKRLETSFFRLYSDIFSVFSLILNTRHFVGLLCFSR